MATHKCTRCKEDVGEFGIRHKYAQGLFCEKCLRELRGGVSGGILGGLWYGMRRMITELVDWITAPFTRTHKVALRDKETGVKVAYSVAMNRARNIPIDAVTGNPQKR